MEHAKAPPEYWTLLNLNYNLGSCLSGDPHRLVFLKGTMTRLELLQLLVGQARTNGFEFRKWYVGKLGLPWTNAQEALESLAIQRRYYALLFSHEFASTFWKPGELMTFEVPTHTFTRRLADGSIGFVKRKAYTRRSTRADAWRYHLREMALAEEPLRYMKRYLRVEEDLTEVEPEPVIEVEDFDSDEDS